MSGMRQIRVRGASGAVMGVLLAVAGCSEVDSSGTGPGADTGLGGGTSAVSSTGGKAPSNGGTPAATGGRTSTGGAPSNGGLPSSGGASTTPTGGATVAPFGGATSLGSGGATTPATGGNTVVATGGATNPGSGGALVTGGTTATAGAAIAGGAHVVATGGFVATTGGVSSTGGMTATGGRGTGGTAPQFPVLDYSCKTDNDCCVVLYSCMAQSYLVTKTQQSLVQAYVNALPQNPCVACIWPVVQVACVSGTCQGTVVPAGTVSETYAATHCGRLNLPVGGSAGAAGMTAAYSMAISTAGAAGSASVAPIATGGTTSWHCGG